MRTGNCSGEHGQATLELAFCLPIVLLLLGAVIEIGLLAGDQVRVEHAAREAARAAAVDGDLSDIRSAASAGGLEGLEVHVTPQAASRVQGEPVVVDVRYPRDARVPIIGELFSPRMSATAQMRIEKP